MLLFRPLRWTFFSVAVLPLFGTAAFAAGEKLAVFDFQMANLAQFPPSKEDYARLPHLGDLLRQKLQESGRYEIIPLSEEVKQRVAKAPDLRNCNGCAADFAKPLGVKWAVTGEIQKVSNLILNINVYFKEVGTDKPEHAYSVDIRGDNDLSFDHGIKYLVKHSILKQ